MVEGDMFGGRGGMGIKGRVSKDSDEMGNGRGTKKLEKTMRQRPSRRLFS
jgi:hypothetical protein